MGESLYKLTIGSFYHCWIEILYVGIAQYKGSDHFHFIDQSKLSTITPTQYVQSKWTFRKATKKEIQKIKIETL